jgi:hypothetical protein
MILRKTSERIGSMPNPPTNLSASDLQELLDRHAAARRRRDRLPRGSAAWQAADRELHGLEDRILEVPLDPPAGRD